jgi:hypothetical protein
MALTNEQKDELRARVAEAASDPQTVAQAMNYRHIRLSDQQVGYSVRNTIMLLMQWAERQAARGDDTPLTLCAGYAEWQQHGRCVRKGEAGLFILAGGASGDDEGPVDVEGAAGQGEQKRRRYFGGTYVWDVSLTDPLPIDQDATATTMLEREAVAA